MTDSASSRQLVAFGSLEGALATALREPGVLLCQPSRCRGVLLARNTLGCMGQTLVPPRVVEGVAELLLGADPGHRSAFEAFAPHEGFGPGVPLPSGQG